MDDAKGTPEDPDAVRSRLVATQVNTYVREDVTQATPPIKGSRIIVSQAATETNAKAQHGWLIGRHDIRVAFFHAKGSGRVVIILPKGLAPPGVGWRCVKAWYGTREANKYWGNEVTDTLIKEGCRPVVVVPMMFGEPRVRDGVSRSSGSAAALDEVERVLTTHFDKDLATHWTDGVWWRGVRRKTPGQNNQMEPTRSRVGVKQQACRGHCGTVQTETGVEGSTDADHEGDGERTERHR